MLVIKKNIYLVNILILLSFSFCNNVDSYVDKILANENFTPKKTTNSSDYNLPDLVELGIESIIKEEDSYIIAIYALNKEEIAGIQFKLNPSDMFLIKEAYGGRSEVAGFQIHSKDTGPILGFSMTGKTIPPSIIGTEKKDNIVIYLKASLNKPTQDELLNMDFVLASKKGKTMQANFITFDLNQLSSNIK
tara:strand:- start:52 stop:624 length:573 start_codon:yes stop_codon:yes gene_type:complete